MQKCVVSILRDGSLMILFLKFLKMYLFLTARGLHWCKNFFLVSANRGYSLVAVCRLLISVASLVVEQELWATRASAVVAHGSVVAASGLSSSGLIVVAQGLRCSPACGILPDQESKPWLLHWQMDSSPLSHQGSPLEILNVC